MIAYNHYIKFIPALKNNKKIEGSFSNTIIVKESSHTDFDKQLSYELTFFNNQGRDISLYTDRDFLCSKKKQMWAFEVKGVVTFFWHRGTLNLGYIKGNNFTEELLEYWSLHIVLPIFFTIEETYNFLHAGAVELKGKPILFVAKSYGGKSTMIDFFMKKGHIVISDDKVATYKKNDQFFAVPSHPHHRPHRKMEDLGFFIENMASKSKPIHVIYKLEQTKKDAEIIITELKGVEKFISLRYSSEINIFFQQSKRFEYLIQMAKHVSVFKITIPWNINRLDEVYDMICEHSEEVE